MDVRDAAVALAIMLCAARFAAAQDTDTSPEVDPESQRSRAPEFDMPDFDAARGRTLFVIKGCVVCHAVNDVGGDAIRDLGGEVAPPLDARRMPVRMDPFDFFARMWRGSRMMIALQEQRLGYQISLSGDEIADIMAFVYSETEQANFTPDSFTPPIFWYRDTTERSQTSAPGSNRSQNGVRPE